MSELVLPSDELAVFIDDTGHEAFAGDHDYYGLGGYAVLGAHYDALSIHWRSVRETILGNSDAPLHASDFGRNPDLQKPQNLDALSNFFGLSPFFRIAVTATRNMSYPAHLHSAQPVMELLKKYVAHVTALTPAKTVALVFEQSQRADTTLRTHFGTLELEEDGIPIKVEHCICPKSAAVVGLEIADFVVNAAGSETRRRIRGTPGFSKDFQSVFQQAPAIYSRFLMIESVTGAPLEEMAYGQELGS
jgi:hypothetical protein